MKRGLVLFAVGLLYSVAAFGQAYPQKAPEPRGGMGIGIQIDLGDLAKGVAALLGRGGEELPRSAPGEILAAWPLSAPMDGSAIAEAVQGTLLAQQSLTTLGLEIARIGLEEARLDEALERLRGRFPAAAFDRNAFVYPQEAAQAGVSARQYATALVGASGPNALPRPVRIGVIDGALPEQLTLEVAALTHESFVAAPASAHGEAVACILACRPETGFAGLAPKADLAWAAVLAPDEKGRERGDTFRLVSALDWLLAKRVEIIHMSLGSAPNAVLKWALDRTLPRVRAIVAAAGNGGPKASPPYPAAFPGVIAVAAVDAEARPWAQGSRGEHILLAAPGVDVWLPVRQGHYFTGTSFAAPFVTAWIAQRRARGLLVDAGALCAAARDLPPPGRDEVTGCGLLRWSP
ncbi:S8 family serine peptidase [Thiobacter aerophilum]|uniref:S8 family serine peptidase n=1 Tax=Thiobacter aerophilum TaxID=3121275 RepID=A0ABV0EHH4_9BURK